MTTIREQLLGKIPVSERRLKLAGVPTAVLEGGGGSPVVLLHGQGEFAATWLRIIPGLASTNRVIAPDLPGHGASGRGEGALDRGRVLDWLDELIDQTCKSPPVLVGHLLGGAIAMRYAVREDESLERLVLVDTLGLRWYRPTVAFGLAMARFVARPSERSRDRLFDRCFVDLGSVREQMSGDMELLEKYALECANSPQLSSALRSLMPGLGIPPIHPDERARIQVPTALIWGRRDLQTPVKTAAGVARRQGWPLHIIDDAADDPAHEQPLAFLEVLRGLMHATPSPQGR